MKKIKIYCDWGLNFDLKHEKQIELYVDKVPFNKPSADTVRFFISC